MWRSQVQRLLSLSSFRGVPAALQQGQVPATSAASLFPLEAIGTPSTSSYATSHGMNASLQQQAVSLGNFAARFNQTGLDGGANSSSGNWASASSAPSRGGTVGVRFASSSSSASSGWTSPATVLPFSDGKPPPIPPQYERLGKVTGPFTVERQAAFAVVEVGGTQYKVTPDDLIYSEKLGGIDVNDTVALSRVLMLGTADTTVVGRPYIVGARVTAVVEEQFLDGKVLIFKKRRRKNSRRLKGHRQPLTALRITRVEGVPSM